MVSSRKFQGRFIPPQGTPRIGSPCPRLYRVKKAPAGCLVIRKVRRAHQGCYVHIWWDEVCISLEDEKQNDKQKCWNATIEFPLFCRLPAKAFYLLVVSLRRCGSWVSSGSFHLEKFDPLRGMWELHLAETLQVTSNNLISSCLQFQLTYCGSTLGFYLGVFWWLICIFCSSQVPEVFLTRLWKWFTPVCFLGPKESNWLKITSWLSLPPTF